MAKKEPVARGIVKNHIKRKGVHAKGRRPNLRVRRFMKSLMLDKADK